MKLDSRHIMTKKAGISYLEILIMIISIFAFSYLLYQTSSLFGQVSAQSIVQTNNNDYSEDENQIYESEEILTEKSISNEQSQWGCCQETIFGNYCQDIPIDSCNELCSVECLPTKCEFSSTCKLGCCFDSEEGTCGLSSPQAACEGEWYENKGCNIPECENACCVLGKETVFTTEQRCEKLSSFYGLEFDYRQEITNEIACYSLAYQQDEGACLIEQGGERTCKFTTKSECISLTGNANNFFKNYLCSHPDINASCIRQSYTGCVEGREEVYWFDSCGNKENVYDSNKDASWNNGKKLGLNESCNPDSGNIENKDCGNCNYFLGSRCGLANELDIEHGEYICNNLNCKNAPYVVDALGNVLKNKDRINGESWCVYDSVIGSGKDIVGSRHFKYYCIDGKVEVEPCADFRQEICVESQIEEEENKISQASCVINKWRSCLDYNVNAEKKGDKIDYKKVIEQCSNNSDCYVKELDFGKSYNFYQCLPRYPPGLDLEQRGDLAESVCSMGNFECIKVEVKTLTGWDCVAGCDCDSKSYTQQMNDWCISLGDCGGYVNIIGGEDEAYSIDGAGKINLNQYDKFVKPQEGNIAEPGDVSGYLGEIYSEADLELLELELLQEGQEFEKKIDLPAKGIGLLTGIGSKIFKVNSLIPGSHVGGPSSYPGGHIVKIPNPTLAAISNVLSGIGAGALAGGIVAKIFGLKGQAATLTVIGGAVAGGVAGVIAGKAIAAAASGGVAGGGIVGSIAVGVSNALGGGAIGSMGGVFAAGGLIGLAAAIIIMVVMKILGIGDTRETHVYFTCHPWQAPTGGDDCEVCNDAGLKSCSQYRCSSLGQACELINLGTEEEKCIWNNPDDKKVPEISPDYEFISEGYKYEEIPEGLKLRQENGDCIEAYSSVEYGLLTDEVSQCKFDVSDSEFDELEYYFGNDNVFREKHRTVFMSPGVEAFAAEFNLSYHYVLDKIGDMKFYVKCQDVNGNKNMKSYLVDICIKSGPDLTPPYIRKTSPESNSFLVYNDTEKEIKIWANEPAECKWSYDDKDYDSMENEFSCENNLQDAELYGWPCYSTVRNLTQIDNNIYIKCKDKPWSEERNTMQESFLLSLHSTINPLQIIRIKPNGTIIEGQEPVTQTLEVTTEGGSEAGLSSCSYSFTGYENMIPFFNTFSTFHTQTFTLLTRGLHTIYIKCEDEAGNVAIKLHKFRIDIDRISPEINRVYKKSGKLYIHTTENSECKYDFDSCYFNWENASRMTGIHKEHSAEWNSQQIYYIKCKDIWDNKPLDCSIVVKPEDI